MKKIIAVVAISAALGGVGCAPLSLTLQPFFGLRPQSHRSMSPFRRCTGATAGSSSMN